LNRRKFSTILRDRWEQIPDDPEHKEEKDELLRQIMQARKQELDLLKLGIRRRKAKKKEKKEESKVVAPNPGLPPEWLKKKE